MPDHTTDCALLMLTFNEPCYCGKEKKDDVRTMAREDDGDDFGIDK